MPNRISYLKARYCRALLRTALNSPEADARRLVYCLGTERPTINTSSDINLAEVEALAALGKMAERVQERGVSSIATHWDDTNEVIERWIEVAFKNDER
jgi:hypothetical protein